MIDAQSAILACCHLSLGGAGDYASGVPKHFQERMPCGLFVLNVPVGTLDKSKQHCHDKAHGEYTHKVIHGFAAADARQHQR
jgi:hypothetical protein